MVGVVRARQEGGRRHLRGRARRRSPTWPRRRCGRPPPRTALRGQAARRRARSRAAAEQAAEGTEPAGRPQRDAPTTSATSRACSRRRALEEAAAYALTGALGSPGRRQRGPGRRGLPRRPGPARRPSTSPPRSSSRCCSRARRAWARPRSRKALAAATGARLIRLQCHEGIDLHHALYDWDYARQLLAHPRRRGRASPARRAVRPRVPARAPAARGARARRPGRAADRRGRPRRRRVRGVPARVPVRLPGHDPRARDGRARSGRPLVVLTSNRTRELHDALKRRCLYHWIDYPTPEREAEIVRARAARRARGDRRARRAPRSRGCAARSSTSCPAWGRRSPGRARCSALGARRSLDDDARRRAEGPRGHRPRPRERGARWCLRAAVRGWPLAGARRRAAGGRRPRAASGELRARRHRALAAVDAGLARGRLPRAARGAVLLATRTCAVFAAALHASSARRGRPVRDPLADARRDRQGALPRVGVPGAAAPGPSRSPSPTPVPAAWSDDGAAAREGLRRLHRRRARASPGGCSRGWRCAARRARSRRTRADAPARRPATTCARRSAPRCATAASWSSAATASPPRDRAGSCSSATSRARWRPTRACCCSTCRPASPPARGSRRSRSARA